MSNHPKDKDIQRVMDSLKTDIPAVLDRRINDMIRENISSPGSFLTRLNPFVKWSPIIAAGIFFLILGLKHKMGDNQAIKPVKEIRIEYKIKDKNIKILWVKKEGFLLNRRKK